MKRLICILFCVVVVLGLAAPVWAEDGLTIQLTTGSAPALVVDNADLLTDEEEERLQTLARTISNQQACDVVIVTEYGIGSKTPMEYADDYFDYNGYGQGAQRSGLLLLLSMAERDWWISTRGEAIQAFTDQGIQYLWSKGSRRVSNGDYYDGFRNILNTADTMLSAYRGTLSDQELEAFQNDFNHFTGNVPRERHPVKSLIFALVIGAVLAFIPVSVMKSELKTVRSEFDAKNYMRRNSLRLDRNRDIYLYANTTSRIIETQRSGGGGGSSTHISSSGASHGGGGGKF